MGDRPNIHYHQSGSGSGSGGAILLAVVNFFLQVALMTLQLLLWLIPKIIEGIIWTVRNVVVPAIRALAEFVVRQATKASGARRRRPTQRASSDRGWRR